MPAALRVVVLSHNTRALLADCLRSLLSDEESAAWNMVVVDNASQDGSPDVVRRDFPGISLVASSTNLGFSGGNNLGAADAQEPYLLFLNSDTVVPAGTVGALLGFMDEHPDCAAAGPRLLNPDGSLQWSCRTFPGPLNTLLEGFWLDRLFPRSRFFGRPRMTWLDHSANAVVEYISGAALMVRREAFEAAGGWPEEYFFYAEDADLCHSLQRSAGDVRFFGQVAITHIGGASAEQRSEETTLEAHRSVLLFALRTGGPGRLLAQRAATALTTALRLLAATLVLPVAILRGSARPAWRRIGLLARVLRLALSRVRPAGGG